MHSRANWPGLGLSGDDKSLASVTGAIFLSFPAPLLFISSPPSSGTQTKDNNDFIMTSVTGNTGRLAGREISNRIGVTGAERTDERGRRPSVQDFRMSDRTIKIQPVQKSVEDWPLFGDNRTECRCCRSISHRAPYPCDSRAYRYLQGETMIYLLGLIESHEKERN